MTDSTKNRRRFLQAATGAALAGGVLAGCKDQDSAQKQQTTATKPKGKTYKWKLVTTWPPNLPVFADGVKRMAQEIEVLSGGRLQIDVYGGGELVPPLETFEAVRQGTAQMGHGAAYYWSGRSQATQFFTAVPFGMNAQQMYAWLYAGGGMALWEELYADFGLVPIPAGNSGVQMGGWFNQEIGSMADFKGLKMRMPGLGGKVIAGAGASAELLPGGELYTSLERGVIDATEWVGPYHDYIMGFHKVASHYYYPGWHEPGSVLELIVNKRAFESLDSDLQAIVRYAAQSLNGWMLARFDAENANYLTKLKQETEVKILPFPDAVMSKLQEIALGVVSDIAAQDPVSKKVYASFSAFQKHVAPWSNLSEKAFYESIQIDV